jgi:hypothetical protein
MGDSFHRTEYIRAGGTAFCWRCRQFHPATVGHRLICPEFGPGRMVVRKRVEEKFI